MKNQIKKDINSIYNITRCKNITAEQMAYIINAVILPRIEYKAHLTIFNEYEANMLTTNLRKLLRYKMGVTNTIPNVLLSKKEIYRMIDFYDRQSETHIINLLLRMNDTNTLGISTEIRLRHLQHTE